MSATRDPSSSSGPITTERRHARRVVLNVPVVVTPLALAEVELQPALARVYERVQASTERVGTSFPAVIRDISVGGAFITGDVLPLLSRVLLTFELESYGPVEAIAWTMWRRKNDCAISGPDGRSIELPQGFGILFEAIPLEARIAIHNLVIDLDTGNDT